MIFKNNSDYKKSPIAIKKQIFTILIYIKVIWMLLFWAKIRNLYRIRKNIVNKICY